MSTDLDAAGATQRARLHAEGREAGEAFRSVGEQVNAWMAGLREGAKEQPPPAVVDPRPRSWWAFSCLSLCVLVTLSTTAEAIGHAIPPLFAAVLCLTTSALAWRIWWTRHAD